MTHKQKQVKNISQIYASDLIETFLLKENYLKSNNDLTPRLLFTSLVSTEIGFGLYP